MNRSAFAPAMLLAVVLIAAKLAIMGWPVALDEAGDLIGITAEDLLLVCGFGVAAALLLAATAGRPGAHRWVWRGVLGLGALAAFYGVLNVGIYHSLRNPLNVRMLTLVGRVGDMRSSIMAQATPGMVAGMVGVPLAYVLVIRRLVRPAGLKTKTVAIAMTAAWVTCGMIFQAHAAPDGWLRRAGKNAHRELVGSAIVEAFFEKRVELPTGFPAGYAADFRLAAQRKGEPVTAAGGPRNVIIVVLESTSSRYLSLYGSTFDTTPNLLAAADHAVVFDNFYANAGYTFCSMMPIVYSVYPGLPWCWRPGGERPMPRAFPQLLADRGYRSGYFSAANLEWHGMGYMAEKAGFAEVFDNHNLGGEAVSSWGTTDAAVVDGLLHWIDADRGKPFYAVAWTDQTHHPYTAPEGAEVVAFPIGAGHPHADTLGRYLNALREADRQVGRLLEGLKQRGLADDTLVVITGDHGEAFGDAHDVMGHGSNLFDESIRVPMMLWNPRLFPTGRRVDRPGGHVDINPTIAQLMGVGPPEDWQGASLLSDDHPGRVYSVIEISDYQFLVREGRYKYVLNATMGLERMYDMIADPMEQNDISTALPGKCRELRERVSAFVASEEKYLRGR